MPAIRIKNSTKERLSERPCKEYEIPSHTIRCAQEPRLAKSAWLAPVSESVVDTDERIRGVARGERIFSVVVQNRKT